MGLKNWLIKIGILKEKQVPPAPPKTNKPTILQREPTRDELALGYAHVGEDDNGNPLWKLKGVPQSHRSTHLYVVGSSGSGKTRFLETLVRQDIANGEGFGVIDLHGDLTEDLKGYLEAKEGDDFLRERVVLIDPSDPDNTVCFNPLERIDGMDTDAVAGEVVEVFKKIWSEAWGDRLNDLLTSTLIALIENNLTLAELPRFLTDASFRDMVLSNVKHPLCLEYFERYNRRAERTRDEWTESTLNKVRAFLTNTKLRQMLSSPKSSFSFRDVMDNKKILLVKLDRGRLKGSADLLGSLLLAKIQMAAFSRTDTPESERAPFYLYIDEFQNFATESFLQTLAQSRKYSLPLILAHQNLAQLSPSLRASILTNCKLQAYFNISRDDANILAKESLSSIYNDPPGWEWYIQQLQGLLPRICIVKNKVEGGVAKIITPEMPLPHETAEVDAQLFTQLVANADIGGAYLRSRKEADEEYESRRATISNSAEEHSYKERRRS